MTSCREIEKWITELASGPAAGMPAGIREHLLGCSACDETLAAARLSRGLLSSAADVPEPPVGFADRVLTALAAHQRPSRPEAEMWRLGWGLMPVFAATVAVLLMLFEFQARPISGPVGLLPTEGLSASENIVLGGSPPGPDEILTAVMEGGGT
jgi:hypothetical protein